LSRRSVCARGRAALGGESVQVKVRRGTEEIVRTAILKPRLYETSPHAEVLYRSVEAGGAASSNRDAGAGGSDAGGRSPKVCLHSPVRAARTWTRWSTRCWERWKACHGPTGPRFHVRLEFLRSGRTSLGSLVDGAQGCARAPDASLERSGRSHSVPGLTSVARSARGGVNGFAL
jgi:hypothetical protein